MPGWRGSDRKERLPENWAALRKQILRRDGWQCTHIRTDGDGTERCPEVATDVDHIVPGDDHDPSNLRALCRYHHEKKSGAEGARAKAAARRRVARRFLRQEAHPGSLE